MNFLLLLIIIGSSLLIAVFEKAYYRELLLGIGITTAIFFIGQPIGKFIRFTSDLGKSLLFIFGWSSLKILTILGVTAIVAYRSNMHVLSFILSVLTSYLIFLIYDILAIHSRANLQHQMEIQNKSV